MVKDQSWDLTGNKTGLDSMSFMRKAEPSKPKTEGKSSERQGHRKLCPRCGREAHKGQQKCPAKDATCHNCHKKWHYSQQCYHCRVTPRREMSDMSDKDLDSLFFETLKKNDGTCWKAAIQLEGKNHI